MDKQQGEKPAEPESKPAIQANLASRKLKLYWKKFWHFIWEDESLLSWLANVALAFILIKFIVYPGFGLVLQTTHPVVAVMSSSMEHGGEFDLWWEKDMAICGQRKPCAQRDFYAGYNISTSMFQGFKFRNGFDTGDIMVIRGTNPEDFKVGDVMVYWGGTETIPIIHMVISITEENGRLYFRTKGDNNAGLNNNEVKIDSKLIVGKALFRVPYLGWVKIGFVNTVAKIGDCFRNGFTGVNGCFARNAAA